MRNMFRRNVFAAACMLTLAALPTCATAQSRPDKAPPAVQQEFSAFIGKFRAALKANDAAAVATMTRIPFFHDNAMRDASVFRTKVYPAYFTARNRTCLQRGRGVYDMDGEKNHNFFIFCGQQIFVFTRTPSGFLFTEVGAND